MGRAVRRLSGWSTQRGRRGAPENAAGRAGGCGRQAAPPARAPAAGPRRGHAAGHPRPAATPCAGPPGAVDAARFAALLDRGPGVDASPPRPRAARLEALGLGRRGTVRGVWAAAPALATQARRLDDLAPLVGGRGAGRGTSGAGVRRPRGGRRGAPCPKNGGLASRESCWRRLGARSLPAPVAMRRRSGQAVREVRRAVGRRAGDRPRSLRAGWSRTCCHRTPSLDLAAPATPLRPPATPAAGDTVAMPGRARAAGADRAAGRRGPAPAGAGCCWCG